MQARRIRICNVVLSLQPGGLENGVVNVVNRLDTSMFESSVCCLQEAGEFADRLRREVPVAVMGLRPGNDPLLPLRLASLFRKLDVDIVHTRNAESFFYGVVAAKLARVPAVVHSEHGRKFPETRARSLLQRFLLRHVDAAFTVSAELREALWTHLRIPRDRFEVIANGVETTRFGGPPATCSPTAPPVIGSVGRLVAVKNFPLLLRAVSRLRDAHVLLVGDGPERGKLQALARDLGLESRVEFAGHRDDVSPWLRRMDVFVLPSTSEGMSNTLLEAMAAGVPAIASNIGGNPELIEHGVTGLLFESDSESSLLAQLECLLGSEALRTQLATNAGVRVRQDFSIDAMIHRYEDLYRRVAANLKGVRLVSAGC